MNIARPAKWISHMRISQFRYERYIVHPNCRGPHSCPSSPVYWSCVYSQGTTNCPPTPGMVMGVGGTLPAPWSVHHLSFPCGAGGDGCQTTLQRSPPEHSIPPQCCHPGCGWQWSGVTGELHAGGMHSSWGRRSEVQEGWTGDGDSRVPRAPLLPASTSDRLPCHLTGTVVCCWWGSPLSRPPGPPASLRASQPSRSGWMLSKALETVEGHDSPDVCVCMCSVEHGDAGIVHTNFWLAFKLQGVSFDYV